MEILNIRLRPCNESDADVYLNIEFDSESIRVSEVKILPQRSKNVIEKWLAKESAQDNDYSLSITVET